MKFKRSERIVFITEYLSRRPNERIPLSVFVNKFSQAKSSISEDLRIIKAVFEEESIGRIETTHGAQGGVTFIPHISYEKATKIVDQFKQEISETKRILPGGYLYLSDIVGNSSLMAQFGDLIATMYDDKKIDAIVTIATKGIPMAHAVASKINVPVAVIRKDNKITEGSTVSVNYVSGSTRKIETMILAKRTLEEGSRVLVIDDFLRAGGSINGVITLMEEFKATVVGVSVLVESKDTPGNRRYKDYTSIVKVSKIDEYNETFVVEEGNCLEYFRKR